MHSFPSAGSFAGRPLALAVLSVVVAGGGMFSQPADAQTSSSPSVVIVSIEPTSPSTAAPTAAPTTAPPATDAATTAAPTTAAPTTVAPTAVPTTILATTTAPTAAPTRSVPATRPNRPTPTPTTKKPAPTIRRAPSRGTSIEIDISAQRLYLYKGGALFKSMGISTGSGRRFCEKNGRGCQTAHTPRGRFRVYSRIGGWRTSRLGRLYNPLYFSGGYAIHGGNLPGYPASHGCVRISMGNARWFPGSVPGGTPVWIHD